jgi:transposase
VRLPRALTAASIRQALRASKGIAGYTGSISKCGDRRVRTLLYEVANVMLTRYKGPLKLKDWAFAIAKRSTMRKVRIALARRLAIIMSAHPRRCSTFHLLNWDRTRRLLFRG